MKLPPLTTPAITSDGLRRALGPWQSAAMVAGTLIGTGIFFVAHDMLLAVHTLGWILLAWVLGGFLSLAGALAYAELGTLRPAAGGEYVYLRDGLGGGVGFLFGWGMFWLIRPASVATIAAGFALAARYLWPGLAQPLLAGWGSAFTGEHVLGAAVIALVTSINYFGVRYGGQLQAAFTALKVALLVALTLAALLWGHGDWAHFSQSLAVPGGAVAGWGGFATALVAALWAFDGWNDLTLAGSEIRDPARTIPRAMIGGVALVFVVYASINLAYFYVLQPAEIAANNNVASAMAARLLGPQAGLWVAAAVMISSFATLNSSILSGARVPFAMARDGLFFPFLAHVQPRFQTPDTALAVQALFAMALSLTGTFQTLYTLTIFAEWLFYALAIVSLFAFRRGGEQAPFSASGYPVLPAVFLVLAAALLVLTFSQHVGYSALGLAVILAGIPAYYGFARRLKPGR
ncbi:MAG TPA: amino acid permease [Terriglobales bacterium]|jgi:APA family basic amino acid/polyamine antiporter